MRIFLTGATGHVGSAVMDALLRTGHDVTALVRNSENAERVSRRGAEAIVGELSKPASYAAAAEAADSIVHTALEPSKRAQEVDRQAIETLLAAADRRAASGRAASFTGTSAMWVLGNTSGRATEDSQPDPTPLVRWRLEHERIVLARNGSRIRTTVIRPGVVYGGARGVFGDLLKDAANGLVRVIGNGQNHWACIYDRDLADLYVRVATMDEASGIFHANDEADERIVDIVEAIAAQVKLRPDVRHVPLEEARAKMGPYADALALDQIVRSPRARALGWAPTLHSVAGSVARLLEEFRTAREAA
jgi:nucleoside-diphosphate-sugar epimerase